MSILSKSGVGRIKHIDDWVLEQNEPALSYQYDEADDSIRLWVGSFVNRVVIKSIPPVRIKAIFGANTVTLFKLHINSDNVDLFPMRGLNSEFFTLEASNCRFDHNRHKAINYAKFTSCVFDEFYLRGCDDMGRFTLDNCTIKCLKRNFQITPAIVDKWRKFKNNNTIEEVREE